jgi:hypothetical protein
LHVKTLKRDAPSAFSPQRHLHLRLAVCGKTLGIAAFISTADELFGW